MPWGRAFAIWLAIIAAETVHGIARNAFLAPVVGDVPARQIGVAVGSVIILIIALLSARWLRATSTREQLAVGAFWVALTMLFEIGLGRLMGVSRDRLLADYDMARGGFLAIGMLVLALAPWIASHVRKARDR